MEYAEGEVLCEGERQHLHIATVLYGHAVGSEVDMVLEVVYSCGKACPCHRERYGAAEAKSAPFAEIVMPYEMVRPVAACEVGCLLVVERTECRKPQAVAKKRELGVYAAVDSDVASHRA